MVDHARPRALHPAAALCGALLLHAFVLAIRLPSSTPPSGAKPAPQPLEVELELSDAPAHPSAERSEATARAGLPAPAPATDHVRPQPLERADDPTADLASPSAPPEDVATPLGPSPERRRARQTVDLGLDGSLVRELVRQSSQGRTERHEPSIGLLEEGLAARDGARGVSRSSPAVQAAYRAATHAPPQGIGVFEVRTDAAGNVVLVTALSFGLDEARWKRVAGSLQEQLKKRRLRVPPGAVGLATRLRIERGELAKDVADLGRTERGVALGQNHLGPKHRRDESTRASLGPGQITPTLGGSVTGGATQATRVIVLSERAL